MQQDYKVEKRPLLRPPIVSPYAGASTQKVVYVSTKMPFMSAVKRVQKLLVQVEKRDAQAATAQVERDKGRGKRKRDDAADIEQVASLVAQKKLNMDKEAGSTPGEVVLKATGKAIEKALSLGLWFQQRDEYAVTIRTSSVGAIDDIIAKDGSDDEATAAEPVADDSLTDTFTEDRGQKVNEEGSSLNREPPEELPEQAVPESRIRFASVIEIYVSSR